jgi:sarcosine oxidase subunit beta
MTQTCDILVVGGGVIGSSIAYHLARRRAGSVVLLEKSFLGAGSSGKSGAIVRQHYSNVLTASMARLSLRVFEHFEDIVGGPRVFTHTGMVLIVGERDRAGLEANLALQQGLGIDVRQISALDLAAIDPHAQLADGELAAFEAEAGYVDAVQTINSLAEGARAAGADVRLGVEVKALLTSGGRIVGAETNEGRYHCRTVVLATGPWAATLAKDIGVTLPVQACRTQVALFRRPPELVRGGPIYGDFVQGIYCKPAPGDVVHSGSLAGEEVNDRVDPDQYNEACDGSWLPSMRQRLGRRCPALHRGYGRGGYGALYEITPDWHPVIDRLPGLEGVYCAAGFSGHGFKLSPIVGQLMAEFVIDGKPSTLDIAPLRLARFAENKPITTPYSYGVMG